MTPITTLLAAALVMMTIPSNAPVVHGEGVLTVDRGTATSGESLKLSGSRFEPGEAYQIKLVGTLEEFLLATANAGKDGTFALTVNVPAGASEGSYRLQAVAEDGDVSASLDITLLASAPMPNNRSAEPHDMAGMDMPMARSDEIVINREQSGAVWGILGGLIGLSAGLGIGLLGRRRLEHTGS